MKKGMCRMILVLRGIFWEEAQELRGAYSF